MPSLPYQPLRVLFVTSECTPFAMTGGLGDVSSALPIALRSLGVDARVVLPLYQGVDRSRLELLPGTLMVPLGSAHIAARVWRGWLRHGVQVYFIEHDAFFDRPAIYGPNGGAFGDNLVRFAFLSRAVIELPRLLGWTPDVIHANDWQTALAPVYLDTIERNGALARCASLLTIHNIGYQGIFPIEEIGATGLEFLHPRTLEHFGSLNLLKGGLCHSTLLSTVSRSYSREVQTSAFGCGLEGVLRSRTDDLFGILNGIDTEEWDPRTDPFLPAHYGVDSMTGKAECKAALQRNAGLPERPYVPMIGVISRLTHQKGMDVLARTLSRILELDVQIVLLGAGDSDAERFFDEATRTHSDKFRGWVGGFDQRRAHLIEAGCDFLLMPSRYEPCGLNQMYSLRYGTLPIVRATGGLDDTIDNYDERTGEGTGFKFIDLNPSTLYDVIGWAVSTWYDRPHHVRQMQERGMQMDFSWTPAARQYEQVYYAALRRRRQVPSFEAAQAQP
ncbi:MAG: glycogen synthase GlgA [Deltaproteobacteria bacterium]|nr:glycogen synthase GlgA [Deltaproteobacteria bacterium]